MRDDGSDWRNNTLQKNWRQVRARVFSRFLAHAINDGLRDASVDEFPVRSCNQAKLIH